MTASQWIDLGLKLVEVFVFPLIAVLLSRYVRDVRVRSALQVMNDQALLAVQRLNKRRRDLKDPSRPGTWSEGEASGLRASATREVARVLGDSFALLCDRYGSPVRVNSMIGHAVDAHAEATRSPAAPSSSADAQTPTLPPEPPAEGSEKAPEATVEVAAEAIQETSEK